MRPPVEDRIETLTADTFDSRVLESEGPVAVEFMSYSCSYCQDVEPFLQRVAEMEAARERFYRLNIAVDEEIARTYDIEGTPTFIMFLDGAQVGRSVGPPASLESVLQTVTQPFGKR